jgi:hypothetical protein
MSEYLHSLLDTSLQSVSKLRKNNNVIVYASAFLQKPRLDSLALQIAFEDINGFMSEVHGLDYSKGLTLILHTPGGITNAAETLGDYIHTKFNYIEVVVPTYAMSAGTMISLNSDLIIMGRQSQLGPIDSQMPISGNASVSARSIVEQFNKAKADIHTDVVNAHVWAPILGGMSPGLLIEAEKANLYSEAIVERWLHRKGYKHSRKIAHFFNSPLMHKSHGKRIDREEARKQGLRIMDLESDPLLQDAVLTAYHIITILFEKSPSAKIIVNNLGNRWVKNT